MTTLCLRYAILTRTHYTHIHTHQHTHTHTHTHTPTHTYTHTHTHTHQHTHTQTHIHTTHYYTDAVHTQGDTSKQHTTQQKKIAAADIHAMWYPTVRRSILCMSKLYRCIEVSSHNSRVSIGSRGCSRCWNTPCFRYHSIGSPYKCILMIIIASLELNIFLCLYQLMPYTC